jgi:hypothetical protein
MINLYSGPKAIVVLKHISGTNLVSIDFGHDLSLTLKVVSNLVCPIYCVLVHDKSCLFGVDIDEAMR